jgi:hypothetical protein
VAGQAGKEGLHRGVAHLWARSHQGHVPHLAGRERRVCGGAQGALAAVSVQVHGQGCQLRAIGQGVQGKVELAPQGGVVCRAQGAGICAAGGRSCRPRVYWCQVRGTSRATQSAGVAGAATAPPGALIPPAAELPPWAGSRRPAGLAPAGHQRASTGRCWGGAAGSAPRAPGPANPTAGIIRTATGQRLASGRMTPAKANPNGLDRFIGVVGVMGLDASGVDSSSVQALPAPARSCRAGSLSPRQ